MLHQVLVLASEPASHTGSGFGLNLGTLLSGIAAMLLALASGIGSYVRYRQATKNIKKKATRDAAEGVQDAATKLEAQYEARIAQYERTIELQRHASDEQAHMYEERLANLQAFNSTLLAQILKRHK